MRAVLVFGAMLALVGCAGDGDGIFGDLGGDGGDNGIGSADIPSSAELMESITGDLSEGAPEADLGFLESNACVPATQNEKFNGNWVWYTYEQPAGRQVYVEADPESGVDISLIVSQAPEGDTGTGSSAVTGLCEEGLDYNGPNPGEAESVKVTSVGNAYHLIIGVAGAEGESSGAFEVEIYEDDR